MEWIAASGNVNCPCCSEDCPLVPSHIKPAYTVILLLLSDILVHCAGCNRDIKAGEYEGHECVPSLTPEEEKQVVGVSALPEEADPHVHAVVDPDPDIIGTVLEPPLAIHEVLQMECNVKRAISTSPDKGVTQLATGGAVKRMY